MIHGKGGEIIKLFKRSKKIKNETDSISLNPTINDLNSFFNSYDISGSKLTSATYYACMLIRCNSIAKLPLNLLFKDNKGTKKAVNHSVYNLLKYRPNAFMSTHDFLWATEFMRLEYGNAYWVADSDSKGNITALYLLDSRNVSILIDDIGIMDNINDMYYVYTDVRKGQLIYNANNIIHFKNFAIDGIRGRGIKYYLSDLISNEQYATNVIKNRYQTGLQDPLIVEYTGDLNDTKTAKIKNKFASLGGVQNAGKVVPIPSDFKVSQLETKLVNNQFFELQGITATHIANAFGIKPFQLSNINKSTDVEEQNKIFYSDTLQDVLTLYEQEITYKLLSNKERINYFFKFDIDSLLRSNLTSRTASYIAGINNGYMTPAEVREKEDLPYINGTDKLIIGNGASIPLDDLGKQYTKGGT